MTEYTIWNEFDKLTGNNASGNSLYIGKDWDRTGKVYRVSGQDWSRRKMAALISSLDLDNFMLEVSDDTEKRVLNLFKKNGYIPAAYFKYNRSKSYIFEKIS